MVSGSESWIKLKPPSVGIRSKLSLLMQSRTHLGGELGANIYLIDGIFMHLVSVLHNILPSTSYI
jgi:hypothetical protein